MKTQLHSKHHSERGQSLVEVALGLTFLLLLLAGVVDLGRVFFSFIALRDAAQEGAIFGSIAPHDLMGIEARVRSSSSTPVELTDTDNIHVATQFSGQPCGGTDPLTGKTNGVTVTVTYDFDLTMPLIGSVIGSQHFPLNAVVTNTILRPPC